jgi:hypothetical protein
MARTQIAEQDQQDVNERIAAVLEQLAENAPVQEIGYGHPKFQQQLRDAGYFDAFAVPVFQNGREAVARGLKKDTIERAPKLRAGKYLGGAVEVARDNRDRVHLIYKSSTPEDRMKFQAIVSSFDDMVEKIWAEMHAA